jgi:hypothetical protein
MSDTPQPGPVDPSPDAWRVHHQIIAGSLIFIGLMLSAVVVEMFILRSEAIARDLIAMGIPTGAGMALGAPAIKAYENTRR